MRCTRGVLPLFPEYSQQYGPQVPVQFYLYGIVSLLALTYTIISVINIVQGGGHWRSFVADILLPAF
jgi:hypothetical protein